MMEEIVVDHVRTKKNAVWVTVVIVGMEDQAIAKVHKLCINISVVYICASLLHLAVESRDSSQTTVVFVSAWDKSNDSTDKWSNIAQM